MMSKVEPRYIDLEEKIDVSNDFSLTILDNLEQFGFPIKRVYLLKSNAESVVRGHHAHLNQHQILFKVSGTAKVVLQNTNGEKYSFELNNKGVLVPPKHWIELEMGQCSKVLCLASEIYERLQSVDNKEAFAKLA